MSEPRYLSGQMLLALPGMSDPRFERTATAMCVHDTGGALGIVVNRVVEGMTARALFGQLGIPAEAVPETTPVFLGGPVEPQRGFVVHSLDYDAGATLNVAGRWGLTATLDILRDIGAGKGPQRWLLALGYAGWGPGQLDAELTTHGWLNAPATDALLYETEPDARWPQAFASIGVDVGLLSADAGHA
jgi:putative transcriptional regulator